MRFIRELCRKSLTPREQKRKNKLVSIRVTTVDELKLFETQHYFATFAKKELEPMTHSKLTILFRQTLTAL